MNANNEPAGQPGSAPVPTREPLVRPHAGTTAGGPADGQRFDRRRLLATATTGAGAAALAAGLGALAQESVPAPPPPTEQAKAQVTNVAPEESAPARQVAEGSVHLVPFQAAIIEAAAARLIPSDELGPGASEAGVVYFIDRQLYAERVGSFGYRGQRYDQGPYLAGEATQGDQSALPIAERFRLGILGMEHYSQQTFGQGFVQLSPEEQDRVLRDMEDGVPETFGAAALVNIPAVAGPSGTEAAVESAGQVQVGAKAFFELLLTYTVAGFFADPVHGGNRDMVGWKLIGFPGAQLGYGDRILRYGEPFDGPYLSIVDHQTHTMGGA